MKKAMKSALQLASDQIGRANAVAHEPRLGLLASVLL